MQLTSVRIQSRCAWRPFFTGATPEPGYWLHDGQEAEARSQGHC
jgi:hypothetical protein